MKRTHLNGLLLAAAVLTIDLTLSRAARADLTQTVTARISPMSIRVKAGASLKSSHAANSSSDLSVITVYQSGSKVKTVSVAQGQIGIGVLDSGSSTAAALFPATKTKIVVPDHSLLAVSIASAKVTDTKQTKMILGHQAHLFRFSLKEPRFTRTGYAWIAADIAAPSQSESFVPVIVDAFSLSHQFPEMRGTWLEASVVTVTPDFNLKVSTFYQVTAVSNAPIAASTFDVPQNYKATNTITLPAAAPN